MNKKGFTLIELLGVIVILSIIMLIAIPNITSVLEKNKKETYLADAKKLITQAEYEIRTGNVEKPNSTDIVKVTLSYLGTNDVNKDPDDNSYSQTDSYVVIVRNDGYLEYYVNLVATTDTGNRGIYLTKQDNLQGDNRLAQVKKDIEIPDENKIKEITNKTSATIKSY